MVSMNRQRMLAVVLLVIAFLTLAASRAFPFLDGLPRVAEAAVVVVGAACGLAGVWLWVGKTSAS
jgi:hypothetical protein